MRPKLSFLANMQNIVWHEINLVHKVCGCSILLVRVDVKINGSFGRKSAKDCKKT